jgi:hypothetical protein
MLWDGRVWRCCVAERVRGPEAATLVQQDGDARHVQRFGNPSGEARCRRRPVGGMGVFYSARGR